MQSKVIFVDNDMDNMKFMERDLHTSDMVAEYFTSAKEALNHMRHHHVDIVISDSHLDISGMDSITFLKKVQESHPDVYRVMVGDCDGDIKVQLALITRTIEQCFSKSWDVGALLTYLKTFGNKSSYSTAGSEVGRNLSVSG